MTKHLAVFALVVSFLAPLGLCAQPIPRADIVRAMLERSRLLEDVRFDVPLELWKRYARETTPGLAAPLPAPVAGIFEEATYGIAIAEDRTVTLTASLRLHVFDPARCRNMAVLSSQWAWEAVTVNGKAATLATVEKWLRFSPTDPGPYVLSAKTNLKRLPPAGRTLATAVPRTVRTVVTLDSPGAWELSTGADRRRVRGSAAAGTHGQLALTARTQLTLHCRPPVIERERPARYQLRGPIAWNIDAGRQQVSARLNVAILGGRTDRIELALPPAAQQVRVAGPDVRDSQRSGGGVTVFLRGRTAEKTRLRIDYELPAAKGRAALSPPGIRDGRWAGGTLVISNTAGGSELLPGDVTGLTELALPDLPAAARAITAGPAVLGYQIAGGRWAVAVELLDLGEFALRETIVDLAHYELLLQSHGAILCKANYEIRNRTRQFLRVNLPAGSVPLLARVNDEPRPLTPIPGRKDAYLLPLVRSTASVKGLVSFPVEIVLLCRTAPLSEEGTAALPLPRVDLPIAYAWCQALLPPGMQAKQWAGPLTQVAQYSNETATAYLGYGRGEAAAGYKQADRPTPKASPALARPEESKKAEPREDPKPRDKPAPPPAKKPSTKTTSPSPGVKGPKPSPVAQEQLPRLGRGDGAPGGGGSGQRGGIGFIPLPRVTMGKSGAGDATGPAASAGKMRQMLGDNYYRAGRDFYAKGDYDKAAEALKQAAKLAPDTLAATNSLRLLSNIDVATGKKKLRSRAEKAAGAQVQAQVEMSNEMLLGRQQTFVEQGILAAREGREAEAQKQFSAAEALSKKLVSRGADEKDQESRLRDAREQLGLYRQQKREESKVIRRQLERYKGEGKYTKALQEAQKLRAITQSDFEDQADRDADTADKLAEGLSAELQELTVLAVRQKDDQARRRAQLKRLSAAGQGQGQGEGQAQPRGTVTRPFPVQARAEGTSSSSGFFGVGRRQSGREPGRTFDDEIQRALSDSGRALQQARPDLSNARKVALWAQEALQRNKANLPALEYAQRSRQAKELLARVDRAAKESRSGGERGDRGGPSGREGPSPTLAAPRSVEALTREANRLLRDAKPDEARKLLDDIRRRYALEHGFDDKVVKRLTESLGETSETDSGRQAVTVRGMRDRERGVADGKKDTPPGPPAPPRRPPPAGIATDPAAAAEWDRAWNIAEVRRKMAEISSMAREQRDVQAEIQKAQRQLHQRKRAAERKYGAEHKRTREIDREIAALLERLGRTDEQRYISDLEAAGVKRKGTFEAQVGKATVDGGFIYAPTVTVPDGGTLFVGGQKGTQRGQAGIEMDWDRVPWHDLLTYPKDWPETTRAREGYGAGAQRESDANRVARRKLQENRPRLEFVEIPLDSAVDFMRDVTGLNIVVNWNALKAAGVEKNKPVDADLTNVTNEKALKALLAAAGGTVPLAYGIDEGVIVISTRDTFAARTPTRVYDVRDLVVKVPAFRGPGLSLDRSGFIDEEAGLFARGAKAGTVQAGQGMWAEAFTDQRGRGRAPRGELDVWSGHADPARHTPHDAATDPITGATTRPASWASQTFFTNRSVLRGTQYEARPPGEQVGTVTRRYDIRDLTVAAGESRGNLGGTNGYDAAQTRKVQEMIRQAVDPQSWQSEGGRLGTMRVSNGTLVIDQTYGNQDKVRGLLSQLRQAQGPNVQIGANIAGQRAAGEIADGWFNNATDMNAGVQVTGDSGGTLIIADLITINAGTAQTTKAGTTQATFDGDFRRFIESNYAWAADRPTTAAPTTRPAAAGALPDSGGDGPAVDLGGTFFEDIQADFFLRDPQGSQRDSGVPVLSNIPVLGRHLTPGQVANAGNSPAFIAEQARKNWGQKIAIGSINVNAGAGEAASLGIRFRQGVNDVSYTVVDEAQFRTLMEIDARNRRQGASVEANEFTQDTIIGTDALLANGWIGNARFAGDDRNTLDVNGNPIILTHEKYILIDNGGYLTAVRAGEMRHWQQKIEPIRFAQVPQTIDVPHVGREFKLEKTLIKPTDELVIRITYLWKGEHE